ncbi:MAG: alkene reductase [Bacteroidales bacterium]
MVTYYGQRVSAGLIIAEATNISPQAVGYMNSPGIWSDEMVEAWKPVTQAVHERKGVIFLQLWHTGRVSHSLLQPGRKAPVAPSPIPVSGHVLTPDGRLPHDMPRALETSEIPGIVNDYAQAAKKALEAGFDGVEIHAANGYLPDQFLHSSSNQRTDGYGGTVEKRCRFVLEVTEACCKLTGPGKTGIRLSPSGIYKDMFDEDPVALYTCLIEHLNSFPLAYIHLMEPYVPLEPPERFKSYPKNVTAFFKPLIRKPVITNVGFTFESANEVIRKGDADMVAFGKLFISNPDLVERFEHNYPLARWDESTFYHGGEKGYIDYPAFKK